MKTLTVNDVLQYLTMIRINFENAYKTQTQEEQKLLLKSWYAILKDYPKEVCDQAVINALKNAEFAPRIGSIVKEIEKMQEAYEKSQEELWTELTATFREVADCAYKFRFTYVEENGKTQGENARERVKEIFNNLSPEIRDYVRNERALIELTELTSNQLNYEKRNFEKVIPQIKQRAKTRATTGTMANLIKGLNIFLLEENADS